MNAVNRTRRVAMLVAVAIATAAAVDIVVVGARRARADGVHPLLEAGFRAMYGLDFAASEAAFAEYERLQPGDPLGYSAQAACVLFKEFDRLKVLDAEFYVDDKKLFSESKTPPDPIVRQRMVALTERAKQISGIALQSDPRNAQALFARAMANGLMADYSALIEHKYLAASSIGKAGLEDANRLLEVDPTFYDAYIWPGVTNYVVASLAFPIRWLAKLRGFPGNRKTGFADLQLTAQKGGLLKPYAKILLVVVNLRDKNRAAARTLLAELSTEFPTNALFEKHARRLGAR